MFDIFARVLHGSVKRYRRNADAYEFEVAAGTFDLCLCGELLVIWKMNLVRID